MENDVLYNRIMNVVHSEYGSGSTATANPEGEATDALEKIQIGDDIYSISGGGGGGGMLLTISQSGDDTVLDKNYNEIKTAIESGILPFAINTGEYNEIYLAVSYAYTGGKYGVILACGSESMIFLSDTADGVLTLSE